MSSTPDVTLEAVGVKSYAELYALPTNEVIRRLHANPGPVLHAGDAFLAVLVLRAVADLRQSAEHLDSARQRLDRFGFLLAVIATAAAIAQAIQLFT